MSALGKIAIKVFGPKVIISAIKNEDPCAIGKDLATIVDRSLDSQFGVYKSEAIQDVIVPFVRKLVISFNKELLKN